MIKKHFLGLQFHNWFYKPFLFCVVALAFLIQTSCSVKKCALCELDNTTIYKVELKEGSQNNYGKKNFFTYFRPIYLPTADKRTNAYLVDCEGKEPYLIENKKELSRFIKKNMVLVDSLDIRRITTTSDADLYPEADTLQKKPELNLCGRVRNNFKVELRAMAGFRSFDKTGYAPIPGDVPIEKKTFGFGEEGTMITVGPEIAFLPTIATFNNKHRLNLGLMTGFWPVDGGNFVPLALHPRFTFNDITNPLNGNCNTLYLFGDLGTAYDVTAEFKKFWSNKPNAYFWDLGLGADLWSTRKMDFSFDIGYRQTTLPLPSLAENEAWINCLDEHNIPYSSYPRRRAGQVFIRFGLTF